MRSNYATGHGPTPKRLFMHRKYAFLIRDWNMAGCCGEKCTAFGLLVRICYMRGSFLVKILWIDVTWKQCVVN